MVASLTISRIAVAMPRKQAPTTSTTSSRWDSRLNSSFGGASPSSPGTVRVIRASASGSPSRNSEYPRSAPMIISIRRHSVTNWRTGAAGCSTRLASDIPPICGRTDFVGAAPAFVGAAPAGFAGTTTVAGSGAPVGPAGVLAGTGARAGIRGAGVFWETASRRSSSASCMTSRTYLR